MTDPVALTQALLRFNTINPPGEEEACARYLGGLLEGGGFTTQLVPHGQGRASLVARRGRAGPNGPLVFSGHVDVVPLGARPWSFDPFAGELAGGRVLGRGSSDMKGGVAAMVCAAIAGAPAAESRAEIALVITAGEETGCEGARAIVEAGAHGRAGALVIGEPTGNAPYVGHKGALWLRAVLEGITAHGSMPERGDNAIYKAARAVTRLSCFHFSHPSHAMLGKPTLNVGTLHAGININSVPDRAELTVDLRTLPGMSHAQLQASIGEHIGEGARLDTILDLPGIWTQPEHPWVRRVGEIVASVAGETRPVQTATYFSDASIFVPAMGGPTALLLGPGEPALAHQTDEWCAVERIREAQAVYEALIDDWARARGD